MRDWIHCDDHSRGVLAALEKGKSGEVYNLGGGNGTPNIEIIQRTAEADGARRIVHSICRRTDRATTACT